MPGRLPERRIATRLSVRRGAVDGLLVAVVALAMAGTTASRAYADGPRAGHRAARASKAAGAAHGQALSALPGLEAPGFVRNAGRGWSPAAVGRLRFDVQRAWWELASVLEVLPTLPRLDGRPRVDVGGVPLARAVAEAAGCGHPTGALRAHDGCEAPGAARWGGVVPQRTGAPGAALRGAGTRLLRALGLGSIAGQAVLVLEGDEAPADEDEAGGLVALPPRPWEFPDTDDDVQARLPLRARRGRGAMGVTTRVTLRSAALRLVGTF